MDGTDSGLERPLPVPSYPKITGLCVVDGTILAFGALRLANSPFTYIVVE